MKKLINRSDTQSLRSFAIEFAMKISANLKLGTSVVETKQKLSIKEGEKAPESGSNTLRNILYL